MDYQKYLYAVYSSWLGKIIGIRLGAPVENYSSEKIEQLYHGKTGYLVLVTMIPMDRCSSLDHY